MAYIFLDDGGPEANEYESNYFYFDGSDSRAFSQIHAALRGKDPRDPNVRSEIKSICHASLEKRQKLKIDKRTRVTWKESMLWRRFGFLIQISEKIQFRLIGN